jgi:hypothetical protein
MQDTDIFISYSSKDKFIADQLVYHIENAGFTCWIAPRNIEGGAEYSEVIENAILQCKIFLLVFSENSANSSWVKSELNIAFSESKYLIPYKIDATLLKGTMRLLLNDKHWIAKNEDEKKQVDLLISSIQNYFAKLEKGNTDDNAENLFYSDILRKKKRKKMIWGISMLCFLVVITAVVFSIFVTKNQKNTHLYHNLIQQACSIQQNSIDDFIFKRSLLHKIQEIENEIPVFERKDISQILFQVDFKLDSIYIENLTSARAFAKVETKHGLNQALEFYKIVLQIKEDDEVRSELNTIIAKKGIYE